MSSCCKPVSTDGKRMLPISLEGGGGSPEWKRVPFASILRMINERRLAGFHRP
jgi:hypothetical protein